MTINLLTANQSNVETNLAGFSWNVGAGSVFVDSSTAWQGSNSLNVTTDGAVIRQSVAAMVPATSFTPGAQYTVSCFIIAATGTPSIRLGLGADLNLSTFNIFGFGTKTLSTAWVRYSITATVPNTPIFTTLGLFIDTGTVLQALTFHIDGLQVESGASATTWVMGTGLSGSYPTATAPSTIPVRSRYTLRVRNPDLTLGSQITAWRQLGMVSLFNNVSTWALELDALDPVNTLLTQPKYGLNVLRTIYNVNDGTVLAQQTMLNGPATTIDRQAQDNTLTISGKDDMMFLAGRTAYPVTSYSYPTLVNSFSPITYFRLGETGGTSATDSSGHAHTGTYTGGFTLAQAALIDDTNDAVKLNGTTAFVTVPTTGLPTGNAAWSLCAWIQLPVAVGTTSVIMAMGTWGTSHQAPHIAINNTGGAYCGTFSGDTAGSATLSLNTPHLIVGTWDGTTLSCYVDSVLTASATPAALTTVQTAAAVGATGSHINFLNATVDEAFITGNTLTPAQILQLWQTGNNRFNYQYQDSFTGTCESALQYYVNNNGGPASGFTERVIPNLTLGTNNNQGTTVTGAARFDQLILKDGTGLLQQLAISGGNLGFRIIQAGTSLIFGVYTPANRSASVRFSSALGSVLDYGYTLTSPVPENGGNAIIVGGGGVGVQRAWQTVLDTSGTIATWWRIEDFLDARDTTDIPTMQQRANAAIQAAASVTTFTAKLAQTQSAVYGLDFFLGDQVSVIVDSTTFIGTVSEVDITLSSTNEEVITPYVGTPNAIVVEDALAKIRATASAAKARISRLERHT